MPVRSGGGSADEADLRATRRRLPEPGQQHQPHVAETNVVVDFNDGKGQTMHATGDRAIYALHFARRRDE